MHILQGAGSLAVTFHSRTFHSKTLVPLQLRSSIACSLALLIIVVQHLLFCLLVFVLLISYISLLCADFLTSARLFINLFWASFVLIAFSTLRANSDWHESACVCVRSVWVKIVMRRLYLYVSRFCYVVIALHLTFSECSCSARLFENISISWRSVFIDQPPVDFSCLWVSCLISCWFHAFVMRFSWTQCEKIEKDYGWHTCIDRRSVQHRWCEDLWFQCMKICMLR